MTDDIALLTEKEIDQLILNRIHSGPSTEDELVNIVDWAQTARLNETLLDLVLGGTLAITGFDEEDGPIFERNAMEDAA